MKKIGIITYYYFFNYGTMLQAFATQLLFSKSADVDVEIIDYRFGNKTTPKKSDIIRTRLRRIFVYVKEFKRVFVTARYQSKRNLKNTHFERFVSDYFNLSNKRYWFESEIEADPPMYDIYVTGSDQTWSPKIGLSPVLFLSFARESSIKAAYAPSIGVTQLTKNEQEHFRLLLKPYDYLSCRESIGSKILSSIIGKGVDTVLDPTLMISSEEWLSYAKKPSISGKYILCYFLGERDYYRDYVKQLSKQSGLPVYYIPANWKDFKKSNNLLWEVGPSEFLGLIANAEYVCTDSFHGTIFSVNFHREVRVFIKHTGDISGGDNSRLFDILQRLGIQSQLITKYNKGDTIKDTHIDYNNVDALLSIERDKSMKYVERIVQSLD